MFCLQRDCCHVDKYQPPRTLCRATTDGLPQGTGWVSTSFTTDFLTPRSDAKAHHVFQALGTSSQDRGQEFVKKVFEGAAKEATKPKIYTSYQDVYDDPDVDVVYVGKSHDTFGSSEG